MPQAPGQKPPASTNVPGPPAFFMQQPGAQVASVSESPVLNTPSPQAKPATTTAAIGNKQSGFHLSKKTGLILGGILVILLLVGGGAGLYLSQTQQDTRQQASTPTGTARISLTPPSSTLKEGTNQSAAFSLDLTSTPVSINLIELSIDVAGQIPPDLGFTANSLSGLASPSVVLTDSPNGKRLVITYATQGTESFTATDSKVNLGQLKFTVPNTGQMNLRFNAAESKVTIKQGNADILRPPSLITYTFEPLANTTLTPSDEIVDASSSGNQLASSASATSTASATTRTPTPTSSLGIGGGSGATTSATPTRTPTPVSSLSATPTATTSRQSSQPAATQEKPVSGSADMTVILFGFGILSVISGVALWPKNKMSSSTDQ